jgi:hypothetical protein
MMNEWLTLPIAILLVAGGFSLGSIFTEWRMEKKILSKENIIACFKDVDWDSRTFHCGSHLMETVDGESKFYKAPPIKEAIDKLNDLLNVK